MKRGGGLILAALGIMILISSTAYGQAVPPVVDDPLVRMPGTQPNQVALEGPNRCLNCHAGYNTAVEPGFNWKGSMMAQSARDFLFWSCLAVGAQARHRASHVQWPAGPRPTQRQIKQRPRHRQAGQRSHTQSTYRQQGAHAQSRHQCRHPHHRPGAAGATFAAAMAVDFRRAIPMGSTSVRGQRATCGHRWRRDP